VNKAAASAAQLAKCILRHAYSHTTAGSHTVPAQTKISYRFIKQASITVFWVKN